jgi:SNF2 family DNA or RNA helicase
MISNPSDDPRCKTNLILAPMALLDQWKLEIELKTNIGLKCHIHHGQPFVLVMEP